MAGFHAASAGLLSIAPSTSSAISSPALNPATAPHLGSSISSKGQKDANQAPMPGFLSPTAAMASNDMSVDDLPPTSPSSSNSTELDEYVTSLLQGAWLEREKEVCKGREHPPKVD